MLPSKRLKLVAPVLNESGGGPDVRCDRIPFVILLICSIPLPLNGQSPRLTPPFPTYQQGGAPFRALAWADSIPRTGTYWVEGGLIGAVGGLVAAHLLNGLACQDSAKCGSDRRVFVGLIGGFVVGSLIGGGIKKGSE